VKIIQEDIAIHDSIPEANDETLVSDKPNDNMNENRNITPVKSPFKQKSNGKSPHHSKVTVGKYSKRMRIIGQSIT
jgi:hypothetical protein